MKTRQRDMAWNYYPFNCIGGFWFLSFGLSSHPHYGDIVAHLKQHPAARVLDLGSCLGQDLRRLIFDGVPPENLYGCDMFPGFEEIGHALFRDGDRFAGHWLTADIFDESADSPLVQTEGSWSIIGSFMFLHLFSLEEATRACKRMVKLLDPQKGSCVVGTQTGAVQAGEYPLGPPYVKKMGDAVAWRHSRESFIEMWEKVGKELDVQLDIWVEYQSVETMGEEAGGKSVFGGTGNRRIHFLIKRM